MWYSLEMTLPVSLVAPEIRLINVEKHFYESETGLILAQVLRRSKPNSLA